MKEQRLVQLDLLRGCAVLLVMGHHVWVEPSQAGAFFGPSLVWWRLSYLGVDLFFVLSGFLIGGLLFQEAKNHGALNIRRFLVRRCFKIWPSYFAYVFFAILWSAVGTTGGNLLYGFTFMLPNFLHLQNYILTPITHTWSLSVEEHFYLLLPFVLVYAGLRQPHWKKALLGWGITVILIIGGIFVLRSTFATLLRSDLFFAEATWLAQSFQGTLFPIIVGLQLCALASLLFFVPLIRVKSKPEFTIIPFLALSVLLLSATMRIGTTWYFVPRKIAWSFVLFATHLRLDGFAIGILLAWLYVFHSPRLKRWSQHRTLLLGSGALLIGLDGFLPDYLLMTHAIEPFVFALASALILTVMVYLPLEAGSWGLFFKAWPTRLLVFVGTYSYTIYLWHATPARAWIMQNALPTRSDTVRWLVLTPLYLGGSIVLGVIASRLIEIPFLRLRNRVFPGGARAIAEGIS